MSNHDVVHDPTWNGIDRYTCQGCGKQVLWHYLLAQLQWEAKRDAFLKDHEAENLIPRKSDPA